MSKRLPVKEVKTFRLKDCAIPTLWCGESDEPPEEKDPLTRYLRTGTRTECMKKGFGAGMYTERKKNLPSSSVQQIKYIGETYAGRFQEAGIETSIQLVKAMRDMSGEEIEKFLRPILTKGKSLDKRAYNSVLVYLFQHGVSDLPACDSIRVEED